MLSTKVINDGANQHAIYNVVVSKGCGLEHNSNATGRHHDAPAARQTD